MGRGREVSFNSSKCISVVVKISPCGKFKKFKTNKAVLTIVIGLENILCWNLVKSALDKEDSSVPVYLLKIVSEVSISNASLHLCFK